MCEIAAFPRFQNPSVFGTLSWGTSSAPLALALSLKYATVKAARCAHNCNTAGHLECPHTLGNVQSQSPLSRYTPQGGPITRLLFLVPRRVLQVKLPSERYRAIPLHRSYSHTNRGLLSARKLLLNQFARRSLM